MKKLFLIIPILILLVVVPGVNASAGKSKKIEVTSLKSTETIDRNYFAANDRVEIHGTVNGDVFVAGGMVSIDGTINGDLLVAGGEVTISGSVSDDVRVAGGQVRISGKIGKNLTVAGGNIDITESASVGKALVALGGNVNVNAPIGETVNVAVGSLVINSSVGGDLDAAVGMLRITSEASIGGDINYWSDEQASIDDGSSVSGQVSQHDPMMNNPDVDLDEEKIFGFIAGLALIFKIVNTFTWFIIGLLLIKFFPGLLQKSQEILKEKPWNSLGIGLLAALALPLVSVVLLITLVGIPLGGILLVIYSVVLYLAKIPVIYLVGEWVLSKFGKKDHQIWSLVIGLVVYGLITILPIIGGLAGLLATVFGLGAILISKQNIYLEARKNNLI